MQAYKAAVVTNRKRTLGNGANKEAIAKADPQYSVMSFCQLCLP